MALAGNLRTMPLPDILQWIAASSKTGTLQLSRGNVEARIVFRDGCIYSSWSNEPRQSLGQFLVRERLISEEQLFTTLLRQESEGRLLGAILVADGLLSEDQLHSVLATKAQDAVYDLFLWPEGAFQFKEGELPGEILFHVEMDVQSVLMEGIRRVDEWGRIRTFLPSARTTFKVKGSPQLADAAQQQAMALAAAGKTLGEIALEMRRSEFDAAALLFGLLGQDALQVDHVEQETPAPDPVATIRELLAQAYQLLQQKRFDEAVHAYQDVLTLDRLNQNAKKGLIAAREARDRETAFRGVPLDRVPRLAMDLARLTQEAFDPQEGFVISRINGQWDVQSILKVCPIGEEVALKIFARLLARGVIELG